MHLIKIKVRMKAPFIPPNAALAPENIRSRGICQEKRQLEKVSQRRCN